MSRTEEETKNLIKILNEQFDLEILLKQRELKIISDEIKKGHELLNALNQINYFGSAEPSENLGQRILFSQPPARKTEGPRPLFECKADGTFVRLKCCNCDREMFANLLGFINHCRIVHQIVFLTPEDRIERCGIPVDASQVPEEFKKKPPQNISYERDLSNLRSGMQTPITNFPLTQPSIKEYGDESAIAHIPNDLPEEKHVQHKTPVPLKQSKFIPEEDGESRFYIKRKIIVGNIAKPVEDRDLETKFTHKWKLYVRGPANAPNIETFIKKIRVFLHPSYSPNNIVDINFPPFNLVRKGWGEFPIRIQLFFWDLKNKPADVIHMLQLGGPICGKYNLGGERAFDIDLDRNTQFKSANDRIEQDLDILKALEEKDAMYSENVKKYAMEFCVQHKSDLDAFLIEAIESLPIIRPLKSIKQSEPYSCALSLKTFMEWPDYKKKSVERQRAYYLKKQVEEKLKKIGSSKDPERPLTCKQVIFWCRDHGYTPITAVSTRIESKFHCKYCGLEFNCFQNYSEHSMLSQCPLFQKKNEISTLSCASELINQFHVEDDDLSDDHFQMKLYSNLDFKNISLQCSNESEYKNDISPSLRSDWIKPILARLGLIKCDLENRQVLNVLHFATVIFLRNFLEKSRPDSGTLTPLHLLNAVKANHVLQFLSLKYLGKHVEEKD